MTKAIVLKFPSNITCDCFDILNKLNIRTIDDIPHDVLANEMFDSVRAYIKSLDIVDEFSGSDSTGMICFDLPISEDYSQREAILVSTAIFNIINSAFFIPSREPKNKTDYTLYKSTTQNKKEMKKSGIAFYNPDEKLGFHNDVLFRSGEYLIPKYISIMNLFLGYDEPGNFYFLDKRSWKEIKKFSDEAGGRKFSFKPTPVVYESKLKNVNSLDKAHTLPVVWKEKEETFVFCNGELSDDVGDDLILRLKESLLNERNRTFSPQKEFRLMLLRNDLGFHSRDIMKEQRVFSGTTRLMLRAMSKEGIPVPSALI